MEDIELTDQLNQSYKFRGELVSEYDTQSKRPGELTRPRWVEMALYRHEDGGFVVLRAAFSLVYHRSRDACDTGVKTRRNDLPVDAIPCWECKPSPSAEDVWLEDIRYILDRCDKFTGERGSVTDVLTLYRRGSSTPYLSHPARRLLELAEENDDEIRRIRRGEVA